MEMIIFGVYLFLATFNAGSMTTLQFQHYGIYPHVGRDNFRNYMIENNHSALIPSVIPALALLAVNVVLIFLRPDFMSGNEVIFSLGLNLISLVSTFTWQRKLQTEMAKTGFSEGKISLLLSTNWIRVLAFNAQAILAVSIVIAALIK